MQAPDNQDWSRQVHDARQAHGRHRGGVEARIHRLGLGHGKTLSFFLL